MKWSKLVIFTLACSLLLSLISIPASTSGSSIDQTGEPIVLTYEGITAPSATHMALYDRDDNSFLEPISQVRSSFSEFDSAMYSAIASPDGVYATTQALGGEEPQPVYEYVNNASQQVFAFKLDALPLEFTVTWKGYLSIRYTEYMESHHGAILIWNNSNKTWEYIQNWPWTWGPFGTVWTVSKSFSENADDYVDGRGYVYVQVYGQGYYRGSYKKWVDVNTDFVQLSYMPGELRSRVNPISPYWQNAEMVPFEITATAYSPDNVVEVSLYYRYSENRGNENAWSSWSLFGVDDNAGDGWSWEFGALRSDGYYEFYSIAVDAAGNVENAPRDENGKIVADARCGIDRVAPKSSMYPILPYHEGDLPVTIDGMLRAWARDNEDGFKGSGVEQVELWYSFSPDNEQWGENKFHADGDMIAYEYWGFPSLQVQKYGYYGFYTIAVDRAGNQESAPSEVDACTRVAKDRINIAVILAEPSDVEHLPSITKARYEAFLVPDLTHYWDEVSYGALALGAMDFFDDDGNWYKLEKSAGEYIETIPTGGVQYNNDFLKGAIEKADADINYNLYNIVIVVGATPTDDYRASYGYVEWEWTPPRWVLREEYITKSGEVAKRPIRIYDSDGTSVWAHEIGHALGNFLTGKHLPDLYPVESSLISHPPITGDVGPWGLMGWAWNRTHLCSFSKVLLGWLSGYCDVDYGERWIDALPTLSYGYPVYRYNLGEVYKEPLCTAWKRIYYILEIRNTENYSDWDTGVPGTGLVVYQVENSWSWSFGDWVHVTVVPAVRRVDGGYEVIPIEDRYCRVGGKGVRIPGYALIKAQEDYFGEDTYSVKVSIEKTTENIVIAALYPFSPWQQVGAQTAPSLSNTDIYPDLDLHAYTPDGRHVGINYETGEYEVQIPEAITLGDLTNGSEWIGVPSDVKVSFSVSSRDVAEFLEEFPDANINENGLFGFEFAYFDENGTRHESFPILQSIQPGQDVVYTTVTEVKFKNLAVEPFSPNGDGIKDETTISYSLVDNLWRQANVVIEIYNNDNELVKQLFSGIENASVGGVLHLHIWDGRDENGSLVADGVYTVRVRAVDVMGNRGEAAIPVIVDTVLPDSWVDEISPYWHNSPFTITASVLDDRSGVDRVALWYRYSADNSAWVPWSEFAVDNEEPWSWEFGTPEGEGYYEFYSVATDRAGNRELDQLIEEFDSTSLDSVIWSTGRTGVKYDNIEVSGGELRLTARAARSGSYGAHYVVSNSPFDFSQGMIFEVQMSVPTYDAPADFRSEFYLAPVFTINANPHSLPDWLRVSASVNREGVRWMLQRRIGGGGVGTLYTSGPTRKLDGAWRIDINSENVTVWLDGAVVEPTRQHRLNFTSAYVSLCERTKVAPVYTIIYDYVRAYQLVADAGAGIDLTPPSSSVDPIEPYWREAPFAITATASDVPSGVARVELFYQHSFDNLTWSDWRSFGTDDEAPYEWSFDAPAGYGFYEFYSIATDIAGNVEAAPERADTACGVVIPTTVDIDPDTLNLKSKGRWVTVYIELPEGYDVASIDVATILLQGAAAAELKPTEVGDYDCDGAPGLMVKFDRSAVQDILEPGEVELAVTGICNSILRFKGSDVVMVIG